MPNVLLFNSDSPKPPFLAGEVSIGMIWNGEAWMAREENPAIQYVYPKDVGQAIEIYQKYWEKLRTGN
jgi:spermidine/putrescine transport system substrate-binding protein